MTFSFRPAVREGVGLFVAIAGSSRTGKTYTALRLARGIAGPSGRIAAIDTEGKRMSHYADEFRFDVDNMLSPFNADRFVERAKGAQEAGYDVLVIDSFSLEWSGAGGVLAEHSRRLEAKGGAQKESDRIWNQVKGPGSQHKLMMDSFLQLTIPVIFCLRAHEVADHLGGGWKVDQDKRFLFEWTVGLTLHPETPGMPRYDIVDAKKKPLWKVSDQHRHLFPERKLIGEEAGAALAAWRNSLEARSTTSAAPAERKQTFAEWLAELEEDLTEADSLDLVEARLGRDDVKKVQEVGNAAVKARVDEAARKALARFEGPSFAPAQQPADEGVAA